MRKINIGFFAVLCILLIGCSSKPKFYCIGSEHNDLVLLLQKEGHEVVLLSTQQEAIAATPKGSILLLLADKYPEDKGMLSENELKEIERKDLHVYLEYASIVNSESTSDPKSMNLERVVVTDSTFCKELPYMSLLGINGSYVLPMKAENPILVVAKVAGFDKADYGLENTETFPLLYRYNDHVMVATSPLSHFASARFSPESSWKKVWESILSDMKGDPIVFNTWLSYVNPAFGKTEQLPDSARRESIAKGIEWYYNGHFLIHDSWKKDWLDKYIGDGSMPVGPELPRDAKDGDGTSGVLEGHCSFIYHDGTQKYRYWLRNDVQGESAMAFSLVGKLLDRKDYLKVAQNLNNFSFDRFRQGPRSDPNSPTYGLLSWAVTSPDTYYGDDNARSILGSMTAAAILQDTCLNKKIIECIIGNFRTSGKNGFRGDRLEDADIQKNGWKHYFKGDKINPHPHFESWIWACYLWLYAETHYKPLLERAKNGIRITMESYPSKWGWTNGIQQEKARMILPLAWLVRVEPTDENKKWLNFMVDELLKNQVECGAIREELGDPNAGMFGKTKSNADYGKHEAPLISRNGDPVADMLYTSNFAFIGLNEAAKATGDLKHIEAVNKLSDFLTRIQVRSEHFKNVDGAWFRAFNYKNWDYWASNADAGWGACSTLTGWIQSWIVATQTLLEMDSSMWDIVRKLSVDESWSSVKKEMLDK
ncbi:hypothetical protein [Bacteroides sp.]|uniref:hypothetical protein n=1 Tax=Bacteroides sp. TaxID=29523 RepID=UPI002608AAEB|nr:hypothetical protein [Bacteroides sp.]MDD3038015.1 hypothetical protein [Bacteroides sp.]